MESSPSPRYYVWEVPAKPVSIHVNLDVVDRLGMAVTDGFKSLPRRGLETGGLLLGRSRRNGPGVILELEDFEALDSEHVVGPSYLLSSADRKTLEERLAWRKSGAGKWGVVGFYRSHTRKDFAVTVEDIDLFSGYFGRASDIFLLIKSNEMGPPTAGFIIREDGRVRANTPYLAFPFDRAALLAGGGRVVEPAPPPEQVEKKVAEPPKALPASGRALRRWVWACGGAGLMLAASLATVRWTNPAAIVHSDALALRVAAEESALRLDWNRQAASVRKATRGVLSITDGTHQETIELNPAQLTAGGLAYFPKSGDVSFHLEIFAGQSVTAESLRVLGTPEPLPVTAANAPLEPQTATPESAIAPTEVAAAELPPPQPLRIALNRADRSAPSVPRLRAFEEPPLIRARSSAVSEDSLPAAPVVLAANSAPTEAIPALGTSGPLDVPDPLLRVSVEPIAGSGFGRRLGRFLGKRQGDGQFTPPAPVRRSRLEIPAHLRRDLAGEEPIDVKVYVDPAGKVEYAELLSTANKENRDLAALAVFSARRWEFSPAQSGDRTVAGEVILHFRFGPETP